MQSLPTEVCCVYSDILSIPFTDDDDDGIIVIMLLMMVM